MYSPTTSYYLHWDQEASGREYCLHTFLQTGGREAEPSPPLSAGHEQWCSDSDKRLFGSLWLRGGQSSYLVLAQLKVPNNEWLTPHLAMSNNSLPRWPILMSSPMWLVEHILLLQWDNVICQALLDLWGDSSNPWTIYALLVVPPWYPHSYLWQHIQCMTPL
jgi:hypothetical protein